MIFQTFLDEQLSNYACVIEGPALMVDVHGDKAFNPASVIKLFVLYAGLVQVEQGFIQFDDLITFSDTERVPGSGVLKDLRANSMSFLDLMTLMIIVSDNTATNILMDHLGIDKIQEIIESIGINHTKVRRKLYHMIPGVFNQSSPLDAIKVLKAIDHGSLLSSRTRNMGMDILSRQQYHLVGKLLENCGHCGRLLESNHCQCGTYVGNIDPVTPEIYSKTGEISGHVHDAGILMVEGQKTYFAIFTEEQVDNQATQMAMASIGKRLYKTIKGEV